MKNLSLKPPLSRCGREGGVGREGVGGVRAEAGYNMVVLVVAITVLNIMVAAMLPLWSTQIRREKEEELIFRGFQYAEAIRIFHNRYQHYPNRLEELILVKPRCIRQLWKDPMTDDGKWGLIFDQSANPPPPLKNRGEGKNTEDDQEDENGRGPQFGPKKDDTVQIGPIVGVRSKSHDKSFIVLFGRERYDEWTFTESVLLGGQAGPGQTPGNLQLSYRWLGRPLRFLNQPPDATLPDPNQNPKRPPKP